MKHFIAGRKQLTHGCLNLCPLNCSPRDPLKGPLGFLSSELGFIHSLSAASLANDLDQKVEPIQCIYPSILSVPGGGKTSDDSLNLTGVLGSSGLMLRRMTLCCRMWSLEQKSHHLYEIRHLCTRIHHETLFTGCWRYLLEAEVREDLRFFPEFSVTPLSHLHTLLA